MATSRSSAKSYERDGVGWHRWLPALLGAVVIAACGSNAGQMQAVSVGGAAGAAGEVAAGEFRSVEVGPVGQPRDALVLVGDDSLFVFGGYEVEQGSVRAPLGTAALLDLATGNWRKVPPAPFSGHLYHPAGVWTGAEFVVLGNPCGTTTLDLDEAQCEAVTLEAAGFDPVSRSWRKLPVPSLSFDSTLPVMPSGLGWTGTYALFRVGSLEGTFVGLDPDRQEWDVVPELREVSELFCFAGSTLYGVTTTPEADDVYRSLPPEVLRKAPIRTFRLDGTSLRWEEGASIEKPDVGLASERVECGDGTKGELLYVPIGKADVAEQDVDLPILDGVLWYQPETGTWERLPKPAANAYGRQQIGRAGDQIVWWPESGDEVWQLGLDQDVWKSLTKPSARGVSVLGGAQGVLILRSADVDDPLDLAMYRPAAG